MKRIYLASPYSHPDQNIRKLRFDQVCRVAAHLIAEGHIVFSPIAHSHPIANHMNNHNDSDFWTKLDLSFLNSWADEMIILMLDGYEKSEGIKREIEAAKKLSIPIKYI